MPEQSRVLPAYLRNAVRRSAGKQCPRPTPNFELCELYAANSRAWGRLEYKLGPAFRAYERTTESTGCRAALDDQFWPIADSLLKAGIDPLRTLRIDELL